MDKRTPGAVRHRTRASRGASPAETEPAPDGGNASEAPPEDAPAAEAPQQAQGDAADDIPPEVAERIRRFARMAVYEDRQHLANTTLALYDRYLPASVLDWMLVEELAFNELQTEHYRLARKAVLGNAIGSQAVARRFTTQDAIRANELVHVPGADQRVASSMVRSGMTEEHQFMNLTRHYREAHEDGIADALRDLVAIDAILMSLGKRAQSLTATLDRRLLPPQDSQRDGGQRRD